MAKILSDHARYRNGIEYLWSDHQQLPFKDQLLNLDHQQRNIHLLLLWEFAGLVASGTDRGTYAHGDVRGVFMHRNMGVDKLTNYQKRFRIRIILRSDINSGNLPCFIDEKPTNADIPLAA